MDNLIFYLAKMALVLAFLATTPTRGKKKAVLVTYLFVIFILKAIFSLIKPKAETFARRRKARLFRVKSWPTNNSIFRTLVDR